MGKKDTDQPAASPVALGSIILVIVILAFIGTLIWYFIHFGGVP